jgi:hypothetical protein
VQCSLEFYPWTGPPSRPGPEAAEWPQASCLGSLGLGFLWYQMKGQTWPKAPLCSQNADSFRCNTSELPLVRSSRVLRSRSQGHHMVQSPKHGGLWADHTYTQHLPGWELYHRHLLGFFSMGLAANGLSTNGCWGSRPCSLSWSMLGKKALWVVLLHPHRGWKKLMVHQWKQTNDATRGAGAQFTVAHRHILHARGSARLSSAVQFLPLFLANFTIS